MHQDAQHAMGEALGIQKEAKDIASSERSSHSNTGDSMQITLYKASYVQDT